MSLEREIPEENIKDLTKPGNGIYIFSEHNFHLICKLSVRKQIKLMTICSSISNHLYNLLLKEKKNLQNLGNVSNWWIIHFFSPDECVSVA